MQEIDWISAIEKCSISLYNSFDLLNKLPVPLDARWSRRERKKKMHGSGSVIAKHRQHAVKMEPNTYKSDIVTVPGIHGGECRKYSECFRTLGKHLCMAGTTGVHNLQILNTIIRN